MANIAVFIPMKSLAIAKSRLMGHLTEAQRERIVSRLLWTVMEASVASRQVTATWMIGGDEPVKKIALQAGATYLPDHGNDLNSTVTAAFKEWFHQNGDAALFLPADLPFVTTADIDSLIQTSGRQLRSVVFSPAARDSGTNAILMPKQATFPTQLGTDSFQKHINEAARLGHPVAYAFNQNIALDVDTIDDLRQWRQIRPTDFESRESWNLMQNRSEARREREEQARRGG